MKNRIVMSISGGIITDVFVDEGTKEQYDITIIDYDIEGSNSEIKKIDNKDALVYKIDPRENTLLIKEIDKL